MQEVGCSLMKLNQQQQQPKQRHIQVRVSDGVYKAVNMLAIQRGMTMQSLLTSVVEAALSTREGQRLSELAGYEDNRMNRVAKFFASAPAELQAAVLGIVSGWESLTHGKVNK